MEQNFLGGFSYFPLRMFKYKARLSLIRQHPAMRWSMSSEMFPAAAGEVLPGDEGAADEVLRQVGAQGEGDLLTGGHGPVGRFEPGIPGKEHGAIQHIGSSCQ